MIKGLAGNDCVRRIPNAKIDTELSMPLVVKCPICRNAVPWEENPHRPFCSERCGLIDLGAWVEGRYRIPGEKIGPESKEENAEDEEDSEEQEEPS